jgi:transcriptional regulator with XRE-family HTH domain
MALPIHSHVAAPDSHVPAPDVAENFVASPVREPQPPAAKLRVTAPPISEAPVRKATVPDAPVLAGRSADATTRKHRVAEIREQQGVSQRTLARRLGTDVKTLQALERPESDLSLSQMLAFQSALEVPLIDLLEDHSELSRPIAERAKMVKVMKTAAALREVKSNPRVARMAQMLCEQLVDVMPELAEVSGWPQFGSRRGPSALGKALSQPIDTSDLRIPD